MLNPALVLISRVHLCHVLFLRRQNEVIGIEARPVGADVVDLRPLRYWSDEDSVNRSVT